MNYIAYIALTVIVSTVYTLLYSMSTRAADVDDDFESVSFSFSVLEVVRLGRPEKRREVFDRCAETVVGL